MIYYWNGDAMVKRMDERFSVDSTEREFHPRGSAPDEPLGESDAASAGVFRLA